MKFGTLAFLYLRRVRAQPAQELLTLVGIATGVALLFAVQVANTSVTSGAEELSKGVTGRATLEVAARSNGSFSEDSAAQIKSIPGVENAAAVMERRVAISEAESRRGVTLIGADRDVSDLGGALLEDFGKAENSYPGVAISEAAAQAVGANTGDEISIHGGSHTGKTDVGAILTSDDYGALADGLVVVAPLARAQALIGERDRVTRVLVEPESGRQEAVRSALIARFGDKLNVRSSSSDVDYLRQAAAPNEQSTALFSAVSAIIGFLFAYCAMLLTVESRRRDIRVLRLDGAGDRKILSSILFDALALGVVASLVGLLAGEILSRNLFKPEPGYLALAFSTGEQRIVEPQTIVLAFAGGLVATLAATARPAFELLRDRDSGALGGGTSNPFLRSSHGISAWAGIAFAGLGICVTALTPAASIVGLALLAVGMVLLLPAILRGALDLADRLSFRIKHGSGLIAVSVSELRSTGMRTAALAATGAVAVFGIVAIEGARRDLLAGLDSVIGDFFGTSSAWVLPDRDENSLASEPFESSAAISAARRTANVSDVRPIHRETLDFDGQRVIVNARPGDEGAAVVREQIVEGSPALAGEHIRNGGWVAISAAFARDRNLQIGDRLAIPTPSGRRTYKIAALINNLGWAPGAIVMNFDDFNDAWQARDEPTALQVDFADRADPSQTLTDLRAALAPQPALRAESARQRTDLVRADVRAGLDRLGQIATLVLVSGALAVAAAMGTAMWQRRPTLAMLKATGIDQGRLWRALLLETGLVLALGSTVGALFGLVGQLMLVNWLEFTTNYPARFTPDFGLAIVTVAILSALALAITAVPGYLAARVSPAAQLQD